ncbi:hypothetical protein QBC35DRAFT_383455 [Podospora australis]|uniref:Enoyl reductase (ER) domain-containing protein n=1 Tax=Podospora australis TaxID=1536484 RepID=A0AAN7AJP4_9PEZI|nr:hypothetical protein QBC35DRAFT_383455 [Podospora australis]
MAAIPQTYKLYRRTPITPGNNTNLTIVQNTEPTLPHAGLSAHDVLIKIHAVSLNYRDLAILKGTYPLPSDPNGVPLSDAAAEVVKIGSAVSRFAVGDYVSLTMNTKNLTGKEDDGFAAPGSDVEGVLREYAIYPEGYLVRLPKHLSWEEAAGMACVGVTAWKSLLLPDTADQGKTVLIQGTGGVSIFTLLLSLAAGFTPIITSSSDAKLEQVKGLGPPGKVLGYNYKAQPDQVQAVSELTNGKGVDIVINNVGTASVIQDINSLVEREGTVSLVGYLEGLNATWKHEELVHLIRKAANLKGIFTGSRDEFQELNNFLEERNVSLKGLVDDRIFSFDEAKEALEYLESGKHVGKVVIKVTA